jgi:hypothetical protein
LICSTYGLVVIQAAKEGVSALLTTGWSVTRNAPDEDHWYFKLAEEDRPEGWKFHRQPGGVFKDGEDWKVNPDAENLFNLPTAYYHQGYAG